MTVKRLKTISELQESGFGQPWPRHGLKLLYCFADWCTSDPRNDEMILSCDPTRGDYGFRLFDNRCSRRNTPLLPNATTPYFIVGNLNSPGAHMLPSYVKRFNFGRINPKCNTDRIIINVQKKKRFGKVYVTTHKEDRSNYDPRGTFHITRTLIKLIQSYYIYYSIDKFLIDTGYQTPNQVVIINKPPIHQLVLTIPSEDDCDAESHTSSKSDNSKNDVEKTTVTCTCNCIIL